MNDGLNTEGYGHEVAVDLAGPGSRMAAVLINYVLSLAAYVPLIASVLMGGGYQKRLTDLSEGKTPADINTAWVLTGLSEENAPADINTTWVLVGFAVLIVYCIVQIFFMSRDGQSLGKKIMGIRVLKTDGRNPGFFGTVFLREVVYYIVLGIVAAAAGYLGQVLTGLGSTYEVVTNVVQLAALMACIVMLYQVKIDRRTLPDFLANTLVVKLPKR